jgi:small conductance mechanosensitive channel
MAGLIVGRILGRVLYKVLAELKLDDLFKKTTNLKISLEKIISKTIKYLIYFIAVITAMTQIGISPVTLNIIMASVILIFLIIIFFMLNYFLPNIIAGIFLKRKDLFHEGDEIKVGSNKGRIIKMNLIETLIKTKNNETVYIPNSVLAKKEIVKSRR